LRFHDAIESDLIYARAQCLGIAALRANSKMHFEPEKQGFLRYRHRQFRVPLQRLRSETRQYRTLRMLYVPRSSPRKAMLRAASLVADMTALLVDNFEHHFEAESPLRWLDSVRFGGRNGKTGGSDAHATTCAPNGTNQKTYR
jgi:hypothetical protein